MACIRVRVTCPECQLPLHLEHAVAAITGPDGVVTLLLDRDAIAMHSCFRDQT